jgi:hypothetical protein
MKLHELPSIFWTELYIIENVIGTSHASLKNQAMKIKYHYSKFQEENIEHIMRVTNKQAYIYYEQLMCLTAGENINLITSSHLAKSRNCRLKAFIAHNGALQHKPHMVA